MEPIYEVINTATNEMVSTGLTKDMVDYLLIEKKLDRAKFAITVISHKEGFKSLKGKDIAYRLKDGDIEVIAVVNDTIEDYECFEVLEMDTQLSWNIPEAHFLLGIK